MTQVSPRRVEKSPPVLHHLKVVPLDPPETVVTKLDNVRTLHRGQYRRVPRTRHLPVHSSYFAQNRDETQARGKRQRRFWLIEQVETPTPLPTSAATAGTVNGHSDMRARVECTRTRSTITSPIFSGTNLTAAVSWPHS